MDHFWAPIVAAIAAATGAGFQPRRVETVAGGSINAAYCLSDGARRYFVKTNRPARLAMFEAERDALRAMQIPGAPRVPRPIAVGASDRQAYLVLEHIRLEGLRSEAWTRLGVQLATLHRATAPEFGWPRANTIGTTPQPNDRAADWIEFWRTWRLGHQLALAAGNGLDRDLARRGARLCERLAGLFENYAPVPSLLHGDLWRGNVAADPDGQPVLFDPAPYYGDREADLAMSELFGRFDAAFYAAYQAHWPLDAGYAHRRTLYNLYHVLNHFNLFGGGYAAQAGRMIRQLLDELA